MTDSDQPFKNEPLPPLNLRSSVSLRNLEPDYWSSDGKSLTIRSVVQSYSVGPIENLVGDPVAQFIKENCRSARRLRTMSISAYETFASGVELPTWAGIGTMSYVSLAAGVSSLDALACALWGILTGEVPESEKRIPALFLVKENLRKRSHPLADAINALWEADWCKNLHEARHRIVHRGFWPEVTEGPQFQFAQDLEEFKFGSHEIPPPKKTQPLDLVTIMRGLLSELEAWDLSLAAILKKHAPYEAYSEEETIVSQIEGQPSADWALGFEVMNHKTTQKFVDLCEKRAEES